MKKYHYLSHISSYFVVEKLNNRYFFCFLTSRESQASLGCNRALSIACLNSLWSEPTSQSCVPAVSTTAGVNYVLPTRGGIRPPPPESSSPTDTNQDFLVSLLLPHYLPLFPSLSLSLSLALSLSVCVCFHLNLQALSGDGH